MKGPLFARLEKEQAIYDESDADDLEDIYPADREPVNDSYMRYFNSGKDCEVEFRVYCEDGELRWIRELMVAMEMKQGKVTLSRGVMQDITRQKAIEMELRESQRNLEALVAATNSS